MRVLARAAITFAGFILAVFLLGLLTMEYTAIGRPKGAIYSMLSTVIIFGVPFLAWFLSGKVIKPPKK